MLLSDEIVPFCAELLESDAYYHKNMLSTSDFNLFDANSLSEEEDSPCFDLLKRQLCYHYYPVCDQDTGNVVPVCSNTCDVLDRDQSCVELLEIVTSDIEAMGYTIPEMQCSVVRFSNNTQVTSQCLDINNGMTIQHHLFLPDQIEYLFSISIASMYV